MPQNFHLLLLQAIQQLTSSFELNLSSYIFHFSLETDFLNCVCDPEVFPLLFAKTKRVIYKLRFLFTAWQRKRKKN